MPLRDHFHSPVNDTHSWDEVHGGWPMEIVRNLKGILPQGYRAGPNIHLGVSEFDIVDADEGDANTTTLTAVEAPFAIVTDLSGPDEYEVRVYDVKREQTLVAAIEIVSPSNKDRQEKRKQFVSKVTSLLQEGVCVSIVDIVTDRQFNMYAELLALIEKTDPRLGEVPPVTYAVTLRRRKLKKKPSQIDVWYYPLAVGQVLPTIPLWLAPTLHIDLPLETSYQETCRLLKIA